MAAGLTLFAGGWAAAQEVAGAVVDARTGRGLEGARVAVQGTQNAARTDAQGRFRLTGVSGSVTLEATMIGYRPATYSASGGETDIRILLSEQAINLAEIVVTGTAGAAEKRSLGNSVTQVRASDVQELAPAPDVSNLINSRAPGVVVIPGSGQVGAGPRIKIRGTNSFSLNDQPLIYVDGVRVANDVAEGINIQAFGSGVVSRLNDFDPDNIDRIEIIKGPAASTLYGTEASNGVVQIFTKRGVAGDKPRIAMSIRQGTQWFMDAEDRIRKPVNMVNGQLVEWNPIRQERDLFEQGLVDRPLFTNGYMMGYGLNVSGGSNVIRYFAGATFDKDNGIEPVNNQRRLTTNLNINLTPNEKWDLQSSLGFVKSKLNQAYEAGAGGIWFSTIFGDPALVDQPERGFLFGPPEFQWGVAQPSHIVNRLTASITINHRPTSWLSHRLTVGQDQTDEGSEELQPFVRPEWRRWCSGDCALGYKFNQRRAVGYTTFDYNANLRFQVRDNIASTTSFGGQYYRRRTDLVWAQGNRFPAPGLETVSTTAETFGFDDFVENSTLGVFGQQQFALNDKLFITGAVRIDNNSAFGDNFDLVVYPKVSASYVLAEGQTGMVNALKLRGAYGQAGQQPETFAALRSYAAVTAGDGSPAIIPGFVGNPDLKPERGTELELGVEAGLLNDRLAADFTFYYQKTRDAILNKALAPSTGFPGNQFINVGAIRNMGFEALFSAIALDKQSVRVQADLNLSHNSNKVLELGEGVDSLGTFGPKVGFPVDAIFRRRVVSATYNPTTKLAENVLCDGGDSGTPLACGTAGAAFLGVWDPRWEGSFSTTVTLGGRLRLYGLVDFKLGNKHFDNNLRALCQVFRRCDENFNPQNYDVLYIAEMQANNIPQNWIINKADFAKLREVSASYSFPRRFAQMVGGQDATFTLSARNLHTWTSWTGLDPEAYFVTELFTRLEQDNTPQLASVQATLNITF